MIEVVLHGRLASFHKGPIRLAVSTVAEAIKAISLQLPGFKPTARRGYERIQVVGYDSAESLFTPVDNAEVHIVPQFNGGKKGGFTQILIGAAAVAVGAFVSTIPGGQWVGGLLIKTGALLILGGIAQLLAPAPESDNSSGDNKASRYLGVPQNTVRIGTRIPIIYGKHKAFGHILSFNINAKKALA